MQLDKQINIPAYVQLRSIFKSLISSGEWTPGMKIPSEMTLCERFQISRPTLRKAVDGLVEEGILYRNRPIGTFVSKRPLPEDKKQMEFAKDTEKSTAFFTGKALLREITFSLENSMMDPFLQYSLWRFEKQTGIRVRLINSGDWRENMSSIVNYALDKKLPDIFWVSGVVVPMFARYGLICQLDDFVAPDRKKYIFDSVPVKKYQMYCYDGHLFGYPFFSETRLLFYRKDHLKQAGISQAQMENLDHDRFKELARHLSRPQDNHWGFAGQMGYNADTLHIMMTFIIQRGGQLYREKAGRLVAATSEPAFAEALGWYIDLLTNKNACPPLTHYPNYQDVSAWFMDGSISMAIERPTLAMIMSHMEDLKGKWGVAPLPQGPVNGYNFLGGVPLCISSQCKDPEAAWRLVDFLTREEFNFPYLQRVGFLPPVEIYDTDYIKTKFPTYYDLFLDKMSNAVPFSYPLPQNILGVEMEEWNKPVQQILRQAARNEIQLEDAVEHMTWMLNSLLRNYL